LERAAIADRVQAGELNAKDGLKQMRELANPYENFKNFAKNGFRADPGNPASAVPNFDDRFSAARPSGQPQAPVKVASPAEARKLPSGTEIILPDGTPGRVP
jgi:hypothetical protein